MTNLADMSETCFSERENGVFPAMLRGPQVRNPALKHASLLATRCSGCSLFSSALLSRVDLSHVPVWGLKQLTHITIQNEA